MLPLAADVRVTPSSTAWRGSCLSRAQCTKPNGFLRQQRDQCKRSRPGAAASEQLAPTASSSGDGAGSGVVRQLPQDMSSTLSLQNIRTSLIRQEDTIIFNLIERAQFARNEAVYIPDAIPVPGFRRDGQRYSLLEYVLRETEQLHGKVRRYTSPDEHAFYPEEQAALVLPPLQYPNPLAPGAHSININSGIMRVYLQDILPAIAASGDDGNYGSASTLDVLCLQALSKRIHFGKFVAEAKFRAQPEAYTQLIKAGDADGLMELLTDSGVERKVVERVRLKAATFGQELGNDDGHSRDGPSYKVAPDILARMYDEMVMPLTKKVQVQYLLRRLDC